MSLPKIDSIFLSNYILAQIGPMVHLKLQKLAFYAEAYHLAYFDDSLINDDFEAWLHGPVSRKIWDHYKLIANIYDPISVTENKKEVIKSFHKTLISDQVDLINDVLQELGKESAYNLECMTHSEFPWQKAREGYAPDDKCEVVIDKSLINEFYKQYLFNV